MVELANRLHGTPEESRSRALCRSSGTACDTPASASPAPHPDRALALETFDRLPLGLVTSGRDWTADTADGTLSVATSSTGPGRELRIHTDGNGRAFLVFDELAPPGISFWARMRLRVDAFPTTPDWTAWKTSVPAVAGTWQCVEFHLEAADNRGPVYFDGVEQPDLTVNTTQHGGTSAPFTFPTFDKLKLGWQLYQADPTPSSYDIRLDDIAVSTRRTGGCGD